MALAVQEIISHPAAETAMHLLTQASQQEEKSFLGMAVSRSPLFFGLISRERFLALCAINIDYYDNIKDIKRQARHLAWHAIDTIDYYGRTAQRDYPAKELTVRQRDLLQMTAANLRADAFSSILSFLDDDSDAVGKIATRRAMDILQALPNCSPEHYPFAIVADTMKAITGQLARKGVSRKRQITTALRIADEIGKIFDESAVGQWLEFGKSAQDMAWRGFKEKEILSAAIHTSDDTGIRALGYLISEVTGIKPAPVLDTRRNYSSFADGDFNERLHHRTTELVFEDVIAQGIRLDSSEPILDMANRQNMALTEGNVTGWCAAALQSSAGTFENALGADKRNALEITRREFERMRGRTAWSALRDIGMRIVERCKRGETVTLNLIPELCGEDMDFSAIRQSVEMTAMGRSSEPRMRPSPERSVEPRHPAPAVAPRLSVPIPGPGGGGFSAATRETEDESKRGRPG